jgi:hypothetical protein
MKPLALQPIVRKLPHGQVLAMLSRPCVLVKREGAEAIPVK